jgi:hypothetical protein
MGVTPFPHSPGYPQGHAEIEPTEPARADWLGITAGSALLGGALLMLTGRKRAGLIVSAAATAVTMLDQKETISELWHAMPQHLDNVQRWLEQAQRRVDDLAAAREKLRTVLKR